MLKFSAAVFLAGFCATSVSANTFYECSFSAKTRGNIPDQVQVDYDAAAGKAMVFDPFINNYVGEPMEAEIKKDNAKRLTLVWSLDMITAKHGGTIVNDSTRMTIVKSTMEATIAYSQGVGEGETGFGTCVVK